MISAVVTRRVPRDIVHLEQALQGMSDGELSPEPHLKHEVMEKGTALSMAAPRSSSSAVAAPCLKGAVLDCLDHHQSIPLT